MLALRIAFRYLRAKKSHRAVNVITLIAVVGVAVATTAMVLVLSIFNGFTDLSLSQLSNLDPDLSVRPKRGKVFAGADSVAARLMSVPGVEAAWPVLSERALLVDGELHIPVVIKGVASGYDSFSPIGGIIIAGQYAEATSYGMPAVQLSVGVANAVSTYPSATSVMRLIAPRRVGRINPANPSAAFRQTDVVFSGVFRVSNPDIDSDHVIAPLETARLLLDYDNDEASAIEIAVAPGASPEKVRKAVSGVMGAEFDVLTRIEQRADTFRMISVEKWVTFMMLVFILAIALFNVISTLSLLAIEKRDNMSTLRALGAPRRMVRNIFIAEGFLVTVLGGAIGIVSGLLIAFAQQYLHLVKLSADSSGLTIDYYPVRVAAADVAAVAAVILVLALAVSAVSLLITRRKQL